MVLHLPIRQFYTTILTYIKDKTLNSVFGSLGWFQKRLFLKEPYTGCQPKLQQLFFEVVMCQIQNSKFFHGYMECVCLCIYLCFEFNIVEEVIEMGERNQVNIVAVLGKKVEPHSDLKNEENPKYQPSGAGGTRSAPATPHRVQHLTARLIQNDRQGMEKG